MLADLLSYCCKPIKKSACLTQLNYFELNLGDKPMETKHVIGMLEYWDNQPAWKAVGDFMLDSYNPPNKSYKPVYDMVYNTLRASHTVTAIERAKKAIDHSN